MLKWPNTITRQGEDEENRRKREGQSLLSSLNAKKEKFLQILSKLEPCARQYKTLREGREPKDGGLELTLTPECFTRVGVYVRSCFHAFQDTTVCFRGIHAEITTLTRCKAKTKRTQQLKHRHAVTHTRAHTYTH
uniref:Uncharacterized protein n=1 Tax=Anguilla anguilla TaxID=7936 RepID=A0A0E9X1K3_ANGAN